MKEDQRLYHMELCIRHIHFRWEMLEKNIYRIFMSSHPSIFWIKLLWILNTMPLSNSCTWLISILDKTSCVMHWFGWSFCTTWGFGIMANRCHPSHYLYLYNFTPEMNKNTNSLVHIKNWNHLCSLQRVVWFLIKSLWINLKGGTHRFKLKI